MIKYPFWLFSAINVYFNSIETIIFSTAISLLQVGVPGQE